MLVQFLVYQKILLFNHVTFLAPTTTILRKWAAQERARKPKLAQESQELAQERARIFWVTKRIFLADNPQKNSAIKGIPYDDVYYKTNCVWFGMISGIHLAWFVFPLENLSGCWHEHWSNEIIVSFQGGSLVDCHHESSWFWRRVWWKSNTLIFPAAACHLSIFRWPNTFVVAHA